MADFTELKNCIRKGTVQSVDAAKMRARVKFGDKGGINSGDLHILVRPVYVVPANGSKESGKTAAVKLSYDKNDSPQTESHAHDAYVTNWLPAVNQMVLCIMTPDGDGEGFIIGGIV